MAIYSNTLAELVEQTCRLLGDWTGGTVSSSTSATTFKDTSRQEGDDFWNAKGAEVYFRAGVHATKTRKITDWGNTTNMFTFAPANTGTSTAGTTYSLHTIFPRDEVVDKINLAIDMVAEEALVWKSDSTSVALTASTYEYDLPTSFMFIHGVIVASSTGGFHNQDRLESNDWGIVHSSTPKIRFNRFHEDQQYEGHYYSGHFADEGISTGRALRIEGLASPDKLSLDADVCPLSPAYLSFQAASLLFMSKAASADSDPKAFFARGQFFQQRADIERANVVNLHLPIGSKRVRE